MKKLDLNNLIQLQDKLENIIDNTNVNTDFYSVRTSTIVDIDDITFYIELITICEKYGEKQGHIEKKVYVKSNIDENIHLGYIPLIESFLNSLTYIQDKNTKIDDIFTIKTTFEYIRK